MFYYLIMIEGLLAKTDEAPNEPTLEEQGQARREYFEMMKRDEINLRELWEWHEQSKRKGWILGVPIYN